LGGEKTCGESRSFKKAPSRISLPLVRGSYKREVRGEGGNGGIVKPRILWKEIANLARGKAATPKH